MADDDRVYTAESIKVVEWPEPVRKRPGMYVGDVHDGSGLHHLLWEVVANSVDEHLAGHASRIRVSAEDGIAEVEDDGRGIPLETVPGSELSALELILTRLHAGPTRDGHVKHVHVSPAGFGLGLALVNALSEELEVEVRRAGFAWRQRFARGLALGPLERGVRCERTGTRLRFRPDRAIFSHTRFDRRVIREQLQEIALWNPGAKFELMCELIHEPRGVAGWVERLAAENEVDEELDVFVARDVRHDMLIEVALAWSADEGSELRSFACQRLTAEGGSHVRGLWRGLIAALIQRRPRAFTRAPRASRLRGRLVRGLLGVVHVNLWHLRYGGPTRDRLDNPEVESAVQGLVSEAFGAYLTEHPGLARRLLARLDG